MDSSDDVETDVSLGATFSVDSTSTGTSVASDDGDVGVSVAPGAVVSVVRTGVGIDSSEDVETDVSLKATVSVDSTPTGTSVASDDGDVEVSTASGAVVSVVCSVVSNVSSDDVGTDVPLRASVSVDSTSTGTSVASDDRDVEVSTASGAIESVVCSGVGMDSSDDVETDVSLGATVSVDSTSTGTSVASDDGDVEDSTASGAVEAAVCSGVGVDSSDDIETDVSLEATVSVDSTPTGTSVASDDGDVEVSTASGAVVSVVCSVVSNVSSDDVGTDVSLGAAVSVDSTTNGTTVASDDGVVEVSTASGAVESVA